jgi:hypothetical protein
MCYYRYDAIQTCAGCCASYCCACYELRVCCALSIVIAAVDACYIHFHMVTVLDNSTTDTVVEMEHTRSHGIEISSGIETPYCR